MSAAQVHAEPEVLEGEHALGELTDRVLAIPLHSRWRTWLFAAGFSLSLALVLVVSIGWLMVAGIGVWGLQIPVAWGLAIINFVWWIGIGHAGTLISAILYLCRQEWRTTVNRFAEVMTLFAVLNAALFPLLHLGRPDAFYYLVPYPNTMDLWPQWRSPLVWDFFAISTYGTVSLLFWYLGLLPDLATLRDTGTRPAVRRLAGVLALGWRGAARQWQRYQSLYLLLAGLATPLVLSVHSIVSLDFARAIVPAWHVTLFPPFFVAGAIFSGLAMVVTIVVPLRPLCRLKDLITDHHLDCLGKLTLASGFLVAYGYAAESFTAWFSGDRYGVAHVEHRLHSPVFMALVLCNVLLVLPLWAPSVRRNPLALFAVAQAINVGMWLERYEIVVEGLERDFVPSIWRDYTPTIWDWGLLLGTLGLFAFLLLVFFRCVPALGIHELKDLAHALGRARYETPTPTAPTTLRSPGGRLQGALAEFTRPEPLLEAAHAARRAGFTRLDAWTPWPLEGLDEALGLRASRMPLIVLGGALAGGCLGYLLQFGTILDFPWNVAGRPLHSWPAFVPITFETTVLGGALAGVLGFLVASRFPRLHHPDFDLPGFERASRDRFFLLLGREPDWQPERARELLSAHTPAQVWELEP